MSTTDYVIPALALGLILIEVFLDNSPKFKRFALIGIGVLTFGFSFWAAWQNTSDVKELKDHTNLILDGRRSDSINNALFQIYLRDTFGLERKGNAASITNIVTYKNVAENISPKLELVTQNEDSANVYYKFENNILYISPKTSTWAHAYYLADTTYLSKNFGIRDEGNSSEIVATTLTIGGKKRGYYSTVISDRAVFFNQPVRLNLSEAPNQYIIFGDQGFPTKRWVFKDGKVKWYPEK